MEVYTLSEGQQSDFPQFWGDVTLPVFSKHALHAVHDLIKDQVEALPLKHSEHQYFAIHVLNVVDALDYDKIEVKRMLRSGRRSGIKKYSFYPEKIKGQHIFKVYLDDRVQSDVLVSDEFKERVTSSSLVGYKFVEVWDSEQSDS
ncbi:hypothetical protein SAMN04488112_11710 [Melghirimyces thermohalophilus]|uniref:Immunity MXAN-0049 protein domain-containing protein n=1 Tax=Melghirimyces thermohalophilus TaxID=1236220 RepID=A0A1G6PK71_9BACL|nr:DUF1629 domain-containing protein [Melghirimyces thermohalophilus]SDC80459.1 hypothetical protein SAMN04488112_11710 [Melghirimyces thermohalophilus]